MTNHWLSQWWTNLLTHWKTRPLQLLQWVWRATIFIKLVYGKAITFHFWSTRSLGLPMRRESNITFTTAFQHMSTDIWWIQTGGVNNLHNNILDKQLWEIPSHIRISKVNIYGMFFMFTHKYVYNSNKQRNDFPTYTYISENLNNHYLNRPAWRRGALLLTWLNFDPSMDK